MLNIQPLHNRMSYLYIIFLLFGIVLSKPYNKQYIVAAYFGIFDDDYIYTMRVNDTIQWSMFDRIYIAFATVNKYGELNNTHIYNNEKIFNIISLYKKARPNGKIFISSDYGDEIDKYYLYAAKNPVKFANSVVNYMNTFNINGYDIDWETSFINNWSNDLVNIITTCSKIFNTKYKITHTIWPEVHSTETVALLSNIVDEINIMSYGINIDNLEKLINQYNNSGFPYEKMMIGIETEFGESKEVILGKVNLVNKYHLAGVYIWRLDNDNMIMVNDTKIPTFKTTKLLYDIIFFVFLKDFLMTFYENLLFFYDIF